VSFIESLVLSNIGGVNVIYPKQIILAVFLSFKP
jgi:hypothetical protein